MADSGERQDEPFLYDAFISYRHVERDRKWAEWLINALERYRVPKALQDKGLPPRLRKVFRDEDEIPASADLNNQIKDALKTSRFLIVVCSPYTPRSRWVAREIEIFNELGRGENVLALLTEGEPRDSFPTAMLERHHEVMEPNGIKRVVKDDKEPLAADVRASRRESKEKLKRFALLRLVARILGVEFDELRQRDHERERNRQLTWAALAAILCLVIGGSALTSWQMMQPKVAYYRQLVWRWGVPEGLGPIDKETHSHRWLNYRVVKQRSSIVQDPRVVEVRRENSAGRLHGGGTLRTDEEGHARWVIRYRDDGSEEKKIEIYDSNSRLVREDVLRRVPFANRLIVTFERNNVPLAQSAAQNLIIDPFHSDQRGPDGKSEITRHELTFDQNGFVTERRYQNYWGTLRHDAEGSFGERFVYLPSGLVIRRAELEPDGAEITLKNGMHAVIFSYDQTFNLVQHTLIGGDDKPFSGSNGFAYFVHEFDRWGNYISTIYHGVDGKPTLHKDGYAKVTSVYDDRGNATEEAYFGIDGKPTLHTDGYAKITSVYDDSGNVTEEAYFGIDGKATLHRSGYAKITSVHNDRGNLIEATFFGVDGKPSLHKSGYAKITSVYDDSGNLIEISFFGVDGKPTLRKDGFAKVTYAYDTRDNDIEANYLGIDGKPTLGKLGYAGFRQEFDGRGNKIGLIYLGLDGKPTLHKDGFAKVTYAYDTCGNEIERAFFGIDGKAAKDLKQLSSMSSRPKP